MSGPWEAYQAQPAGPPRPWQQYRAPAFTSTLNAVVDDPARAAPLSTQAGASLRTRPEEQIDVYSRSMGIPRERFGTLDGQIVYRDDQDRLVRVSPSVTGATGPIDAARRVGGFVARNAGEAIPAIASMPAALGGVIPPASGFTIPAAGFLAAAGEAGRQLLGDAIYGARPRGMDEGNIALQGGMAAGGQAVGLGLGRLIERNPAGVTGNADRAFFRDPSRVTEARRTAQAGTDEGVTLMAGDVTGRSSLLQRDRQLGRFPDTTDDMGEVVRRRNAVEVPAAVGRRIDASAGALPSVEAGRAQFQQGAQNVITTAFERMQGVNSPLFRDAFQANPGAVWNDGLAELIQRPAVARAWQEAQVAAANSGRPLPEVFRVRPGGNGLELAAEAAPDLQAWHLIKRSLDQIVNGGSDPLTGAIRLPGGRDVREARDALRAAIIDATGGADSLYGKALAESAPRLQAFADLEATGIARAAERGGRGAANEGLATMFDGGRMAPERIALYRQEFLDQGQGDAWRAGFSAYLRDALEQAQKVTQRGEPANVAGKFYQQVFGTPQRQEAIAAALGGRNSPEFRAFAGTMDVMRAASRSFPEGSPTATDGNAREGFASGAARAAGAAVNVPNWLRRAGDFITELSAGRNARGIASGYAAGPQNNAAFLDQMRLIPTPLMGLLGAGGQGAAFGLGGLLTAPDDRLPPARQP
jgi:hypothetical protein